MRLLLRARNEKLTGAKPGDLATFEDPGTSSRAVEMLRMGAVLVVLVGSRMIRPIYVATIGTIVIGRGLVVRGVAAVAGRPRLRVAARTS